MLNIIRCNPDAKHDEWRATGEIVDVSKVKDVVLEGIVERLFCAY